MFHDGMVGREDDLSVNRVFIQREGWNRTDRVTNLKIRHSLSHGINNTGGIISKARREYWRFDIFVVTPHRIGPVDTDCLNIDSNFMRARSGYVHLDEFQD